MYCVRCGKELREGAQFCTGCGAEQRKKNEGTPGAAARPSPVEIVRPEPIKKKKASNAPLIVAIIALTLVLMAVVVLIFLLPSGKKSGKNDRDDLRADYEDDEEEDEDEPDEPVEEKPTEADPTPEDPTPTEEPEPAGIQFTICVHDATGSRGLPGAMVELMYGNQIVKTDQSGKATFLLPDEGEYTFSVMAEGFNTREDTYNVKKEDRGKVFPLVPTINNEDAYVLIVWKGKQDLDLCVFDTKTREYVNKTQGIDSLGNYFYEDHDAEYAYELAYLEDVRNDFVRTIYIVDTVNAQAWKPSTMEADGVEVYLYGAGGQWYYKKAKTNMNAALWSPFYTFEGNPKETNEAEYITEYGDHKWISFRLEDQYIPEK